MTDFEYNRIATASDFLSQTNEVRDERRDVPLSDILDSPLYCLKFNEDWKSHILGAVGTLQKWTAWNGDDDDTNTGTRQITKLLAQDMTDCGTGEPCDIEVLLADDEFFETEYIPTTFGTKYSTSEARNEALQTAYDGTPQSIGSSIPTGTPNATEANALCYAIDKFVRLYCMEKTCIIQSRNFLEIAYDAWEDAAEAFYNSILDPMVGVWGSELFGCIIDVPTALTVLADEAAQEELACFLFDALDGVTITESAFTTAIDDAAGTLGGNAALIACVMTEDYQQLVYLNFLQGYNATLLGQLAGEDKPCPCTSDTYALWAWDFTTQGQGDTFLDGISAMLTNFVDGTGWQGVQIPGQNNSGFGIVKPLEAAWKIKKLAFKVTFPVNINNRSIWFRPTPNYAATQTTVVLSVGGTGTFNLYRGDFTPSLTNFRQVALRMISPNASPPVVLSAMAILYEYGFHAPGSIPSSLVDFSTYVHDW